MTWRAQQWLYHYTKKQKIHRVTEYTKVHIRIVSYRIVGYATDAAGM